LTIRARPAAKRRGFASARGQGVEGFQGRKRLARSFKMWGRIFGQEKNPRDILHWGCGFSTEHLWSLLRRGFDDRLGDVRDVERCECFIGQCNKVMRLVLSGFQLDFTGCGFNERVNCFVFLPEPDV